MADLLPISKLKIFITFQDFLKRYITFSCFEMASLQSSRMEKRVPPFLITKTHLESSMIDLLPLSKLF